MEEVFRSHTQVAIQNIYIILLVTTLFSDVITGVEVFFAERFINWGSGVRNR